MPRVTQCKLRTVLAILLGTSLLTSCASLDESECLLADFRFLGEEDGEKGRPRTRIDTYEKDCASYGLAVDRQAYAQGWEVGIVRFCTRDNGYEYGLEGNHYQRSCPVELADVFFNAYQLGRAIYDAKTEVARLETEITRLGDQLAKDERCASTSNRNFEGRQGYKGRTHLVSPGMAAAAAITGKLTDVRDLM